MSDENTPATETVEPTAQAAVPQEQTPTEEFDKDRAMKTILNLRDEEKKWKQERKELEQLRADKAKQEQASLSELEKEKQNRAQAETELQQLKRESNQRKAADEIGLPAKLAGRIQGDSYEAMLEDAKSLLAELPKKTAPVLPPNNPNAQPAGETEEQRRARLLY